MALRVALVHDWLTTCGGAERVLAELLVLFPQAHIFTLFGSTRHLPERAPSPQAFTTSWMQSVPGIQSHYRALAPVMPYAVESLDLRGFDLIISSSWAFAHGILKHKGSKHVAYVHSPMRWAWDMENEYLEQSGLSQVSGVGRILSAVARQQLRSLRAWDRAAGGRPDILVANSAFVQARIRNCWQRESEVIYPPVATPVIPLEGTAPAPEHTLQPPRPYLSLSRLVAYKRVDAWIEAFRAMPSRRLIIAGDGPERPRLERGAPKNVEFLGWVSEGQAQQLFRDARGYLQASKEDFGISVVEAQANGLPVLAYGVGGAQETVRDAARVDEQRPSGLLVQSLEPSALVQAVETFERIPFRPEDCRANAEQFSLDRFQASVRRLVERTLT